MRMRRVPLTPEQGAEIGSALTLRGVSADRVGVAGAGYGAGRHCARSGHDHVRGNLVCRNGLLELREPAAPCPCGDRSGGAWE